MVDLTKQNHVGGREPDGIRSFMFQADSKPTRAGTELYPDAVGTAGLFLTR